MITGNEPIHPFKSDDNTYGITMSSGLTKREYFAALIMATLTNRGVPNSDTADDFAADAVMCADSLIKALNKQPETK